MFTTEDPKNFSFSAVPNEIRNQSHQSNEPNQTPKTKKQTNVIGVEEEDKVEEIVQVEVPVAEEVVEKKVEKKKKATRRPKRKRIVQVDPDYRPQYKKNMGVKEYRWILAYTQNQPEKWDVWENALAYKHQWDDKNLPLFPENRGLLHDRLHSSISDLATYCDFTAANN